MIVREIYSKYRINKGLEEHMLRVAAVAKLLCDHSSSCVDTAAVVTACLVHDLGNLIKAKVDGQHMPELFDPEGIEYWQQVQQEMIEKYGPDEHLATVRMVEEIGLPDRARVCFEAIGNDATERVCTKGTLEEKIANYSDMRVGPFGVISLQARMDDIRARYVGRNKSGFSLEEINTREKLLEQIEKDIFVQVNIYPEEVTDERVGEYRELLGLVVESV